MQKETKYDRRRFLGSAALSIAAAKFVAIDSAQVESGRTKASSANIIKPAKNPSFGPLKQLDAGLRVGPQTSAHLNDDRLLVAVAEGELLA